jgi:hypothetical protein
MWMSMHQLQARQLPQAHEKAHALTAQLVPTMSEVAGDCLQALQPTSLSMT